MEIYRIIDVFIPHYTKNLEDLLFYLELKVKPRKYISAVFNFSLFAGILAGCLLYFFLFTNLLYMLFAILASVASFLVVFFGMLLFISLTISLRADMKATTVETVLPDALALMATNLRAGLTTEQALFSSARPEFGYFKKEIERVGKEVGAGKPIDDALYGMIKRIRSKVAARNIHLIVTGLRSGGELAKLLEESSISLRETMLAKKQMSVSVLSYTIFIIIALTIASPLLLSLTGKLAEVFVELFSTIEITPTAVSAADMPLTSLFSTEMSIKPGLIRTITFMIVVINSVIGSLIVGGLTRGDEKRGLRYLPLLLAAGVGMFFLVRFVLDKVMATFIGY